MTSVADDEYIRALMAKNSGVQAEYIRCLQRSFARFGNKVAAMELGALHYSGKGVTQSYSEALEWFYQALQTTPG